VLVKVATLKQLTVREKEGVGAAVIAVQEAGSVKLVTPSLKLLELF
jgi:hypothetical protein